MNQTAIIPVKITPEAQARVTELGMQTEFEQMLEHTRQHVADLVQIDVVLAERYDTGGEPGVTIEALADRPFVPSDKTSWNLGSWKVRTFPPQVCEHFCIALIYGRPHAG